VHFSHLLHHNKLLPSPVRGGIEGGVILKLLLQLEKSEKNSFCLENISAILYSYIHLKSEKYFISDDIYFSTYSLKSFSKSIPLLY